MPNSPKIERYPLVLFEAFRKAETEDRVVLDCPSPQAARNLRSYAYSLRRLLAASAEPQYLELSAIVEGKKFYIDGAKLIISSTIQVPQVTLL